MKKAPKLKFRIEESEDKSCAWAMAYPVGIHGYPQYSIQSNNNEYDLDLKHASKYSIYELWENFKENKLVDNVKLTYKQSKKLANKFWKKQFKELKRNKEI